VGALEVEKSTIAPPELIIRESTAAPAPGRGHIS